VAFRKERVEAWPSWLPPLIGGWVILWLAVGAWTAVEVRSLGQLSNTVVRSGDAVRETGDALQRLRELPIVGGKLGRVGTRVSTAGLNAEQSGRSSRVAVNRLAIIFGLAIALMPSIPLLVLVCAARRLSWRQTLP
jgi:hypothetical protein